MKKQGGMIRSVIRAVCLVAAGLILLINPDFGSAAISTILGWILITAGGVGLVICICSRQICGAPELAASAITLGVGIYLLFHPLALASLVGILAGIFLIIGGVIRMVNSRRLRNQGDAWLPGFVLAVVMAIIGVVLVLSPLTTSRVFLNLCGVVLILAGVVILIFNNRSGGSRGNGNPNIIDAE